MNRFTVVLQGGLLLVASLTLGSCGGGGDTSVVNPPAVAGVCGSSNDSTVAAAPTTNLCTSGTASALSGTGPWAWVCQGSNGGANASCLANASATPPPNVKTLASISVQPMALQPGYPGMKNAQTISVLALDNLGKPLGGVNVQATGDTGGGWAFPAQAATAADGTVSFSWVPGSVGSGLLTVNAELAGLSKSATVQTQSVNPPTLPLSALNLFAYNTVAATGYAVDLMPNTDPSGTYYAALVWNGGYAGLQRDGSLYHDQLQFSVWNNSSGQAAVVSLGNGVTCVPFGGEGTGQACSLNYPWTTNTTYQFEMNSVAVTGGSQVSLKITNLSSGVNTLVGTLFQPTPATLAYVNTFVEQFSRVAPNCLDQPLRSYSIRHLMAKVNGIWTSLSSGTLVRQGDFSTVCSNVQALTGDPWLTIQIGQRSMSDPYSPQNTYIIPP